MSTDMIWQTESTNSGDTEHLGELLGSQIKPPLLVELVGDLGAGKTCLARGLARGFGSRDFATSPSFSLSNVYETDDGKIYHFDLYRLGDDPGILKAELAEAIAEPKSIVIIEWGKSVENLLPSERLSIELKNDPQNEDKRRLSFKYPESLIGLIEELKTIAAESRP